MNHWNEWAAVLNSESKFLFGSVLSLVAVPPAIGLILCYALFLYFWAVTETARKRICARKEELYRLKGSTGLLPSEILELRDWLANKPSFGAFLPFAIACGAFVCVYLVNLARL